MLNTGPGLREAHRTPDRYIRGVEARGEGLVSTKGGAGKEKGIKSLWTRKLNTGIEHFQCHREQNSQVPLWQQLTRMLFWKKGNTNSLAYSGYQQLHNTTSQVILHVNHNHYSFNWSHAWYGCEFLCTSTLPWRGPSEPLPACHRFLISNSFISYFALLQSLVNLCIF